jgi:hypothetical protein
MTPLIAVVAVLVPAVPGALSLARAFSHRERRAAQRAISWAVVTAMTAGLLVVVTYGRLMAVVAAAPPSLKTSLLSSGLDPIIPGVRLGALLAVVLGFAGGVARGRAADR